MERYADWFNKTGPGGAEPLPALTRAGLSHLYFESIHPFEDGNGRLGRALAEVTCAEHRPANPHLARLHHRERAQGLLRSARAASENARCDRVARLVRGDCLEGPTGHARPGGVFHQQGAFLRSAQRSAERTPGQSHRSNVSRRPWRFQRRPQRRQLSQDHRNLTRNRDRTYRTWSRRCAQPNSASGAT
ncbi:Fic family protein (plasmid) [Rhodobacter capsulatus]|uniref:Fic family protein n=1 Tax=Rhodobacter capsulatus TaxID=1061 RepID=UPI004026251F